MAPDRLDTVFAGEIPELYDRYLVPFIFQGYADHLTALLARQPAERALELAAGTGVVSRTLARERPDVTIVATDLNQAMSDYAASQTDAPNVEWRQADAMDLPFEDGQFDAVLCQFGVMFFPDRVHAFRETRRVLKDGGRFIFTTWDRIEESQIPMVISDAVAEMFPDDPPAFLRRTPHGYHDVAAVRADVAAAGFQLIEVETVRLRSVAPSARDAVLGLTAGTPLRNEIEARDASRLDEAIERATAAVESAFGTGPIEGNIQAHVVVAHDSPEG